MPTSEEPPASVAVPADVAVVIPARYQSSRFPGKPLATILGMPLVLRVCQRVESVIPRHRIFVATDDPRIRSVCEDAGIQVLMTSSKCLTGTDRVWEASRQIGTDFVVNVQGDEPLIRGEDILAVIRGKEGNPACVVNAMCELREREQIESPDVPKVVVDERSRLVYMSRSPIPFAKDSSAEVRYRRQVCIYAFNRGELAAFAELGRKSRTEAPEDIEILRFIDLNIPIHMVEVSGASIAVDRPEDIARVENLLARDPGPL